MIESRRFGTESGQLPVAPGKYRLVVSPSCPWCRRVVIAVRLLGLTDMIALSEATGRGADGFEFIDPQLGFEPHLRVRTIRELYRRQPAWNPGEPTTVPVLLDENGTIVANDSGNLLRDLATVWPRDAAAPELYPTDPELAAGVEQVTDMVTRGVAQIAGTVLHATSEMQTRAALEALHLTLRAVDSMLDGREYLTGELLRACDLVLFTPLQSLLGAGGKAKYADTRQILADYPQLRRWFNARAAQADWMSDTEAATLQINLPV